MVQHGWTRFFNVFFSTFGFEVSLPLRYYSAILQCVRYIVSTDFLRLERPHVERPMEYLGCDEGGLAESMKQVRQTLFYADSLDLSFLRLFPTILCHVISINFFDFALLCGAAPQSCPMGFDLQGFDENDIGMSRE